MRRVEGYPIKCIEMLGKGSVGNNRLNHHKLPEVYQLKCASYYQFKIFVRYRFLKIFKDKP